MDSRFESIVSCGVATQVLDLRDCAMLHRVDANRRSWVSMPQRIGDI